MLYILFCNKSLKRIEKRVFLDVPYRLYPCYFTSKWLFLPPYTVDVFSSYIKCINVVQYCKLLTGLECVRIFLQQHK